MPSKGVYTQEYVDKCRSRIEAQLATYRNLVATAKKKAPANEPSLFSAIDSFEPEFFNDLVIVLEGFFCHRARRIEGKDGNPLNEVRLLCDSMMRNGDTMSGDSTIRMNPAMTVLKYKVGDRIRVKEADFLLLCKAFFAEIEKRYL